MIWYQWVSLGALALFVVIALNHFLRLIRLGKPKDYSKSIGSESSGVAYSMIGAMSPTHKESAYLHLPTYAAGIIYHIATFVSIVLYFLLVFDVLPQGCYREIIAVCLFVGAVCGFAILIKRFCSKILKNLSNPDDYISNIIVDFFQLTTALVLVCPCFEMIYYLLVSVLLIYLPFGKLKHVIYFLAARYHLGFFFGRRGVWPPKKI